MDTYYSKEKEKLPCCSNNIVDIIEQIARSQRDVCSTCTDPVSCDMCFYNAINNTIPVRLTYCCSGEAVTAVIGVGGATTTYFRVECINNRRFVKLRLLTATLVDEEIVVAGTNYTIVVDLECVGSIQCFEPVNITPTAAGV